MQQVVVQHRHARDRDLFGIELELAGQIEVNLVQQRLPAQRLIRFVEPDAETQLVAVGRQIGRDQRLFNVVGQALVDHGELEVTERLAVVERLQHLDRGMHRQDLAGFRQGIEIPVDFFDLAQAVAVEPVARRRDVAVADELVALEQFVLGRVDDDVHRRGAAELPVDQRHALVNLGVVLVVIDEAVFHRQPRYPGQCDQHHDREQQQRAAGSVLGESGDRRGDRSGGIPLALGILPRQ